ncbi:MAG: thermonuclease family protein [Nanoarchaeota archaeon]|nr:thermonuclease family protein [Nanoarchaeota archaeon]
MLKKLVFILLMLFIINGCNQNQLEGPYKVTKVIDGDTIQLNNSKKVRFSGINTPETGECFYQEAKDRLSELIFGKDVFLERDRTDIDKYGRQLRYVYINNILVNSLLVEEGFARVFDKYKADTKRYEELKQIESVAKGKNLGLWGCKDEKAACLYVKSKNSKTYHKPDCKWAKKIKPENLVCIKDESEIKGLNPCKVCLK